MPYKIKLPCGRSAIVDKSTFDQHGHLAWYADWKGTQWQVVCGVPTERGQEKITLANLVLSVHPGQTPDHKNGNTFDNRRSNLRPATRTEQRANVRPAKGRLYKGVFKCGNRWTAKIGKDRKQIYLGLFGSAVEAAREYNKAARRLFGKFARLNPT
jgi:hypothetical protein